MRKSFPVTIPPGLTWPGVSDGAPNIDAIRPYYFIRFHNRGSADVAVGLDGKVQNSPLDYWDYVPAGARITRNIGGEKDEPARGLSLLNVDPVNTAVLRVEISDSPIIDIDHSQLSGSSSVPTVVAGIQTPGDAVATPADLLDVRVFQELLTAAGTWRSAREGQLPGSQVDSAIPAGAVIANGSASTTTGTTLTASVAAAGGLTSYLLGFDASVGAGAAVGTVLVTSTAGLATTLRYAITTTTTLGMLISIRFAVPLPASAVNTAITLQLPAIGGAAGVNALTVYGFQL